jgi:hypothetical protein
LPLNGFEVEKKTGNPVRIKHDKNEGLEIACADDSNASGKAVWDHTQKTPEEIEAAVKEATKHAEEEHDADNEQGEGVVPKGGKEKKKKEQTNRQQGQEKAPKAKAGRNSDKRNKDDANTNKAGEQVGGRPKRTRKATTFYEG